MFVVTGCLQGTLLGMGIFFEIKARRERESTEGEGVRIHVTSAQNHVNNGQVNGIETDDEGGPVVEDGLTEETPLLNGSKKSSAPPAYRD